MRKAISVGIAVAIVMLICAMTTDYKVEKMQRLISIKAKYFYKGPMSLFRGI